MNSSLNIFQSTIDTLNLRAGDRVEIRSKEEILSTLDSNGQLDGLPFMPQMFHYCGRQLTVYKRAHKTCDTVNQTGARRLSNAVHLEGIRCDGQAHGGCQAGCLIFWKDAWLKRLNDDVQEVMSNAPSRTPEDDAPCPGERCTEQHVWRGTQARDQITAEDPTYVCQATQLPNATRPLGWWDLRQYLEDLTSRNIGIGEFLRGFTYASYNNLAQAGIGLGPILRWLYDRFQSLRGGVPYPRRSGSIAVDRSTPHCSLNLKPGEVVRVKSYREILATLNTANKNRGLYFDAEAVPFCGGTYRVLRRVNKIIDERTGKLVRLKGESVILDGVCCNARYSDRRMFCPRSIYTFWREIWLERVADSRSSSKIAAPSETKCHPPAR